MRYSNIQLETSLGLTKYNQMINIIIEVITYGSTVGFKFPGKFSGKEKKSLFYMLFIHFWMPYGF
jgi:hypothetical protein